MNRWVFVLMWFVAASGVSAQEEDAPGEKRISELNERLLSGLKFRSIGPALMAGRIADLAVDQAQPNTWYIAVGSGGLWKTTNAGTTFTPLFDNYPSYSIGCVTIDPRSRHTIWVGTGEAVGGRHVGFGDGVYVSHDGGQSFKSMGLTKTEHIAKILVDPRDSNIVYVAAQGPLWSSGGERGLYRSSDGGKSWHLILAKGPWTGVTDIALDPRNPDVVYAATHQRHRTVAALLNGGPETGIHKSTDGGQTWSELQRGLPKGDKGKIALAISPQKPDVVYATIEMADKAGGFFRSEDAGASWTRMSDYMSGGTGPHYYQELWADPHRFDVLYHANVVLGRTEDGGKTWDGVGNSAKHVDNHAVAFHPTDPDFLLVGCDGGLYKSYDRAVTYDFAENLPITQFYKVDVDYDSPVYHVVGGTQDNNTQYGPTRTLTRNGIRNADWRITIGGDGHDCAIDPEDPNIIYCESQEGYLRRFDRRTGESVDIRPQPGKGEDFFRFNWDSPIHISPHAHTRLYFGSKVLHRSDDRGDSWTTVSPDLSRGLDRYLMKMMARVWSIDAIWDLYAMSQFGNVTSISESPVQEGLIYVGTDDGLIQVTEDGGENWRKIEKIYGVPEYAFVNDVKADRFDADVVYAAVDNHKEGDYKPYLIKSSDRGRTWTSITGNLPDRHLVWRVIQDHVKAELLFAGTEFGVFVTLDGGGKWIKMSGGMPNIPVRDLEIQRREDDLVAATFGRGFYVLDDYSALREMDPQELVNQESVLFPVKTAALYIPDDKLGGTTGSQGSSYYSAENPPYGASFTFYLRQSLQTKKQQRAENERGVKKEGGDNPYPGWDALKEEDRELVPRILLEVRDEKGQTVDRVEAPVAAGLHRIAWQLRYAPFVVRPDDEAPSGRRRRQGDGPLVVPGRYTVQAFQRSGDKTTTLGEPQAFEVQLIGTPTLEPQDRRQVLAFQMKLGKLQQGLTAAQQIIADSLTQLAQIRGVILEGRFAKLEWLDELRALETRLQDAQESLAGDPTRTQRHAIGSPSVASRLQTALYGSMGNLYGITTTQRQQYEIAQQEYDAAIGAIRKLVDVDLPRFQQKLDEAGVPWTPGRKLPTLR